MDIFFGWGSVENLRFNIVFTKIDIMRILKIVYIYIYKCLWTGGRSIENLHHVQLYLKKNVTHYVNSLPNTYLYLNVFREAEKMRLKFFKNNCNT